MERFDQVHQQKHTGIAEQILAAKERLEHPQGDTFSIYQVKNGDDCWAYRFEPLERLHSVGLRVNRKNYDHVYTAPLEKGQTLEDIYRQFNLDHPADFRGRSLSVSDVVVLRQDGKETAHYCDSFGFKLVPEFLNQEKKLHRPDSEISR